MENSCFKIFISKNKECLWLNDMGKRGYKLIKIADSKYYFVHSNNNKYFYSIQHLGFATKSEQAEQYFSELEKNGVFPFLTGGDWTYFYSMKPIEDTPEVYKKSSNVYFWRSLYLFFFSVVCAIVCGYQAFVGNFIKAAGHSGNGLIRSFEIKGVSLLDTLKIWLNGIIEFLNNTYIKLFVNIFGESDASIALAVLIPILIILTVCFAINFNEYLVTKKRFKELIKTNCEVEADEK